MTVPLGKDFQHTGQTEITAGTALNCSRAADLQIPLMLAERCEVKIKVSSPFHFSPHIFLPANHRLPKRHGINPRMGISVIIPSKIVHVDATA